MMQRTMCSSKGRLPYKVWLAPQKDNNVIVIMEVSAQQKTALPGGGQNLANSGTLSLSGQVWCGRLRTAGEPKQTAWRRSDAAVLRPGQTCCTTMFRA